jgi:uncharacterized protein
MASHSHAEVRVVYALPDQQHQLTLQVPSGSTVEQAVQSSAILQRFVEIGPAPKYAVFGRLVDPTYVLSDGDRVEILRTLLVDPKDSRRRAAQSARRNLRSR